MDAKVIIDTPKGQGSVEKIWISELGYLMMKVFFEDRKISINYNLGMHNPEDNIFTNEIKRNSK